MTVLFPTITVKEILEYSCLCSWNEEKEHMQKKENPNKYMYSSKRGVSHFKDKCIHPFFFYLAPVTESMEIRLTFSCTHHQNNSCTWDYTVTQTLHNGLMHCCHVLGIQSTFKFSSALPLTVAIHNTVYVCL